MSPRQLLRFNRNSFIVSLVFFLASGTIANSQTTNVTGNLNVQITITTGCALGTINHINFGTHSVLDTNKYANGTINVTCTPTTPYTLSLNNGSSDPAPRTMKNGAGSISYDLYKTDPSVSPTNRWGSTGLEIVSATGTGIAQAYTVYGMVPPQPTPAAAVYTDIVTITLTY